MYGGTIEGGQYVAPKSISFTGVPVASSAPRVASTIDNNLQFYLMYFAMAQLNTTYDQTQDVSTYLKVSIKGSNDDIDWGSVNPTDLAEFTDPRSLQTYRAVNTPDGRGIGYKLVKNVVDFLPVYKQYEDLYKANPGNATYQRYYQSVQTWLSSMVETLDDVRLWQAVFASGQ
jgi:hypothetical protein